MADGETDWRRYVRFAAVGLFNTGFGYGLYLLLLAIGLAYWLAWGVTLIVVLVVGFVLGGRFVFGRVHPARFVLYCGAWASIYALNLVVMEALSRLEIGPELAPLILLPFNVVLSYIVQKTVVYH